MSIAGITAIYVFLGIRYYHPMNGVYEKEGTHMSNLRKDLILWSDTLQDFHLPRWEELPNFDLYLDQVITLIEGYLQHLFDEENDTILTSAMINNYVKLKLIPKAEKKRYNRVHIAYLIAITILKQVLTISEVKQGIEYQAGINGLKEAFNLFCEEQETAIKAVADHIKKQDSAFQLEGITVQNTVIKMATMSFAGKLVAEKILHLQNSYTRRL